MYNKILVPNDGSKPADNALDHAINLIKSVYNNNKNNNKKIQLIILFVIPNLPVPFGFDRPIRSAKTGEIVSLSGYIKEMQKAIKTNALQMLSEKKKKYECHVSKNAVIKTEVISGNERAIPDIIINFAIKEKIDLIVIGNVGLSGISKVKALGSVSRAIVERTACPVLVVRYNNGSHKKRSSIG
jgi:nucleotide-binding universal stress UspA family protein